MIELTYQRALYFLEEAVRLRGYDHTYEKPATARCAYWHTAAQYGEEGPGCLIGTALNLAGVPRSFFLSQVGDDERDDVDVYISGSDINDDKDAAEVLWILQDRELIKLPNLDELDLIEVLYQAAQSSQDDGETWGRALAEAKRAVTNRRLIKSA